MLLELWIDSGREVHVMIRALLLLKHKVAMGYNIKRAPADVTVVTSTLRNTVTVVDYRR